ncbi:MAG TPA: hypothetical protein VK474_07360, partial [Chthoniobacterales bacterium]|nr:hypothetical protein [Chthoniobacterales bacterium]
MPLVEPEGDGKRQRVARFGPDKCLVHAPVVREICAIMPDRLLKITDHAKATWTRRIGKRSQPAAGCLGPTRDLEQHGELGGIGILRFIQDDNWIELAKTARGFGVLEELIGERDLVGVSDYAALEAEVPVIPLHFRRDTDGCLIHPATQRCEGFRPENVDLFGLRRAVWPPQETGPVAIAVRPRRQLRHRVRDGFAFFDWEKSAIQGIELKLYFWAFAWLVRIQQGRTRSTTQLHDVTKRS